MQCFVSLFLVISASAIDCLERLVSELIYYVLSETLNPTHSLIWATFCCCCAVTFKEQPRLVKCDEVSCDHCNV